MQNAKKYKISEEVPKMIKFLRFIISTFVVIVNFQNIWIWCAARKTNPVCNTAACQALGNMYHANMNKSVSPCTNFYDYVCQNWGKQNPRPDYMIMWRLENVMREETLKYLKTLLDDASSSPTPKYAQASALFKSCMKLPFVKMSEPPIIKKIMMNVGNWPMFLLNNADIPDNISWSLIDAEYLKRTGESALFSFNVAADLSKKNHPITQWIRLQFPYGKLSCHGDKKLPAGAIKHYRSFLKQIILSVAPKDETPFMATIDRDLDDVLNFRNNLVELITTPADQSMTITSIEHFQEWYNKNTPSHPNTKVNWVEHVSATLKSTSIVDPGKIYVEMSYFVALAKLLANTPKRVIVNHIHLYFAERHVVPSTSAMDDLELGFPHTFPARCEIRYEIVRWQWCIENHPMGTTIRRMYIESAMQNKAADIDQLLATEQKILRKQIMGSTWMDSDAKQKTMDVINNMTTSIGYPIWYIGNATADPLDADPLIPAPYYGTISNRLYISAAYLQLPMYHPDMPYAVKYGSIGTTLGHELLHSVGPTSSDGVIRPLWSPAMEKQYMSRLACFDLHFTVAKQPYLTKYNLGRWSKPPKTIDEDVADAVGLKLGYQAYKDKLKESKGICPTLPGFKTAGCEQLFFIAFATQFCSDAAPSGEKILLQIDIHSPDSVRVNQAVSNMKEFQAAFACEPNSPMISDPKCNLFND